MVANEAVVLRPEIPGLVSAIHFEEGTAVEAGAPLVDLDASIYRAELRERETALELSRRNHERVAELLAEGAATARAADEAVAQLETNQASVAVARARLDKTSIRAPFAGIVGFRRVSIGDYVVAGQDLVNLVDIDPIKIEFVVPERYLRLVAEGQTVNVGLDAFPGRSFSGRVYAIDPAVDPETRSVALRATMPNPDGVLRPGLFAQVSLVVSDEVRAVVIPEQAIVPQGTRRFVFKVVDGKAVMTEVTIGLRRYGKVEIVEGLEEGDTIVTAGQLKLFDGAAVEIVEPGQAP